MVLSGSEWLSTVLSGSPRFSITAGGSQCFTVILSSYQWFSMLPVVVNHDQWFSVINTNGSQWFSVALNSVRGGGIRGDDVSTGTGSRFIPVVVNHD